MHLDQSFWEEKYRQHETPWDIGHISEPLKQFIDELPDKTIKLLIPGAGKAHEAKYLLEQGFEKVYVCDWAAMAFDHLRAACPAMPESQMLVKDFFELEGQYDLILEQTFFCAIDPADRGRYVQKAASLLRPGGQLVGLLFASEFDRPGPPFGGYKEAYMELFEPYFNIIEMEPAPNSIAPRLGNELFFKMIVR